MVHLSRTAVAGLAAGYAIAKPLEAVAAAPAKANEAFVLNQMGMAITRFENQTAAKESKAYKKSGSGNPSFLLCNNHNSTVAVIGEINFYHGSGVRTRFRDPEFPDHEALMIEPGTCTLVGNVTSDIGDHGYSGALYGYLGCDENGLHCESTPGVITKVEFATDVQNKKGIWGINLSLVDGYNGDVNMTAGAGKEAKTFACHIDPDVLRNTCPKTHLIDGKFPTCMSDCKATGDNKYCCEGEYVAHGVCKPSSAHLDKLCGKGAYVWPHDDKKYTEAKMTHALEVAFGPQENAKSGSKGKLRGKAPFWLDHSQTKDLGWLSPYIN